MKLDQSKAVIIAALITGVVGVLITGYFQLRQAQIPIEATQTAEAKQTHLIQVDNSQASTLQPSTETPMLPTEEILTATAMSELPTNTPAPKPTNTPRPANTPTNTSVSLGQILFEEDFEDEKAQLLDVYEGNWEVFQDDTGNHVFRVNHVNDDGWVFPGFRYGSLDWDNYVAEYRVKLIETQENMGNSNIVFSFRSNHDNEDYVQAFDPNAASLITAYNLFPDPGWVVFEDIPFQIKTGLWYSIRVEVSGPNVKVFVDDFLFTEFTDSRLQKGGLELQVGPDVVHAQFDDLRVIEIVN